MSAALAAPAPLPFEQAPGQAPPVPALPDTAAALASASGPVRTVATSIESAFLNAGDGLGRGLASFETLEKRLAALGAELSGEAMDGATQALGAVARDLVRTSESLPVDRDTLARLVTCNRSVEARLTGLMERMRMMVTLARAARIEAATVYRRDADFVQFTLEIMTLTRSVQDDLGQYARGQDRLTGLLAEALRAQSALEGQYRGRLRALAEELEAALAALAAQRRGGAQVAAQLSERSRQMSAAVRTAIMSLQAGDATRQRLEHVESGLSLAAGLPPSMAAEGRALLSRLLGAQLADTSAGFGQDVDRIDAAFTTLLGSTRDLIGLGRSVARQDGAARGAGDGKSVIDLVQQRVSRAAVDIATCEGARAGVAGTVGTLQEHLADLKRSVGKLNDIIGDIVLIGLNAGLRAGRLGADGQSLVVIAQELKAVAAGIEADAKALLVLISDLDAVARDLGLVASGRDAGALKREIAQVLDTLRAGDARMAAVLVEIERGGSLFETDLSAARTRFGRAAEFNTALVAVAHDLATLAGPDACDGAVVAAIDAALRPCYTMERERQIHDTVLPDHVPAHAADAPDDIDSLLF